jgi:hypothetical protein
VRLQVTQWVESGFIITESDVTVIEYIFSAASNGLKLATVWFQL